MGLPGCWRIAAVERTTTDMRAPKENRIPVVEVSYYVSSCWRSELSDQDMLDAIIGHWACIENGVHRIRDVTMGEDRSQVGAPIKARSGKLDTPGHPKAARDRTKAVRNMVNLRNFAIGLWNVNKAKKRTQAPSMPAWRRQMKPSKAFQLITR